LIGAAGLVGRHLRQALAGQHVVSTYHRVAEDDGIVLDITQSDEVRRVIRAKRPDVIALAAADAWVERCEREPEATRRVNVDAARVIAEEARAIDAGLVVFSSEYVFDGTKGAYSEEDERHAINEYGRQKMDLEDITLATGRGLVCRTSGVFGPDPARKNFVCQLADRLRADKPFDVPADQLITPTYAPALATAVVQLAASGATGIFHVAGPRVMNRLEFARLASEMYGLPSELIRPRATADLGLAAARPLRCGLRVDKIRGLLGTDLLAPTEALGQMALWDSA
jgi:dTDP-4-dehydrorhamnose reductase